MYACMYVLRTYVCIIHTVCVYILYVYTHVTYVCMYLQYIYIYIYIYIIPHAEKVTMR